MNIEHGAVCWENEASLVIAPNCFFQRSQSDFVILFSKPWVWVSWLQLSTQTVVQVRKYVRWLSLPQVIDLSFQFISIHLSLSLSISLSGKSFPSECNHIARRFVILVFLLHQHFFLSSVRLSVGLSLLLSVGPTVYFCPSVPRSSVRLSHCLFLSVWLSLFLTILQFHCFYQKNFVFINRTALFYPIAIISPICLSVSLCLSPISLPLSPPSLPLTLGCTHMQKCLWS